MALVGTYLNGSTLVTRNVNNNITLGANCRRQSDNHDFGPGWLHQRNSEFSYGQHGGQSGLTAPVWWISGGTSNNILYYWAAAWNRALTAAEHVALATNIWQIFAPAYPAAVFGGQPFGMPHVPILRPVSDRSGSRRLIWAE